jgi:hypothetical protein
MPSHRPGSRAPQWPVGYFLRREGLPELPSSGGFTPTVVGTGLVMCASAGLLSVVLTGQQQHAAGRSGSDDRLMSGPAEPSTYARTALAGVTSAPGTAAAPEAPPTILAQPITGAADAGVVPDGPVDRRDGRSLETWRSPTAVAPVPARIPPPAPAPRPGPGRSPVAGGAGAAGGSGHRSGPDRPALDRDSRRSKAGDELRNRVEPGSGTSRRTAAHSASDKRDSERNESGGDKSDQGRSDRGRSDQGRSEDGSDRKGAGQKDRKDSHKGDPDKDRDRGHSASRATKDHATKDHDKDDRDKDDRDKKHPDGRHSDREDADHKHCDSTAADHKHRDSAGSDSDSDSDERRTAVRDVTIEPTGMSRAGSSGGTGLRGQHRIEPAFSWFGGPSAAAFRPVRSGVHARPAHAAPDPWLPDLTSGAGLIDPRPAPADAS